MSSGSGHRETVSETSPLLGSRPLPGDSQEDTGPSCDDDGDLNSSKKAFSLRGQWTKYLVLLLAGFLVNADSAILFSLFRHIASEFSALESASWVVNSFVIGLIVSQPLYGRLSDIYGRKPLLLVSLATCLVGSIVAGIGVSFEGVLAGRTVAGVGNAGVSALISTLIVDLVPRHEVALWRSFIYTGNQIGRATGPPLGGFISDGLNWRWALLGQTPLYLFSIGFIWWKLKLESPEQNDPASLGQRPSALENLRKIDFAGGITLGIANCSLLLFLDRVQRNLDLRSNSSALAALSIWIVFLMIFFIAETRWTREPMLPLGLLVKRNVFTSYCVQFFQTTAQMALYTSVPLFFTVVMGDSRTEVAFRLTPITIGVITGGLVSGFTLKFTGLYRRLILLSLLLSTGSFVVIFLRWRGPVAWAETLYGLPAGIGFGVSLSAAFIALTSTLDNSHVAIATSGFYLSLNLGSLAGVSVASLFITEGVKRTLLRELAGHPNYKEIIEEVTSDLGNLGHFHSPLKGKIVQAYAKSLVPVWGFAVFCGCLAFASTLLMREAQTVSSKNQKPPQQNASIFRKVWAWVAKHDRSQSS